MQRVRAPAVDTRTLVPRTDKENGEMDLLLLLLIILLIVVVLGGGGYYYRGRW